MTKTKAFELYSTGVPDGRRVVRLVSFGPERVTFWICCRDPRAARELVRGLGVADARVDRSMRPLGAAVDAAAADPDGGVFRPGVHEFRNDGFLPLASFADHFRRAH